MSDITDRAERLLAGITPGPWDADKARDGYMSITSPNGPVVWATGQPGSGANIFDRDAAFIAAAPTLVADLLAEVKRLDNEVDERQGEINTIIEHCWHTGIQYDRTVDVDQIDYPIRVIHELRAEVKRLTNGAKMWEKVATKAIADLDAADERAGHPRHYKLWEIELLHDAGQEFACVPEVRNLRADVERLTPREITTVEELEALPYRSVVIEQPYSHAWIRHSDAWHCGCDGTDIEWSTAEVFEEATIDDGHRLIVVYVPEFDDNAEGGE